MLQTTVPNYYIKYYLIYFLLFFFKKNIVILDQIQVEFILKNAQILEKNINLSNLFNKLKKYSFILLLRTILINIIKCQ